MPSNGHPYLEIISNYFIWFERGFSWTAVFPVEISFLGIWLRCPKYKLLFLKMPYFRWVLSAYRLWFVIYEIKWIPFFFSFIDQVLFHKLMLYQSDKVLFWHLFNYLLPLKASTNGFFWNQCLVQNFGSINWRANWWMWNDWEFSSGFLHFLSFSPFLLPFHLKYLLFLPSSKISFVCHLFVSSSSSFFFLKKIICWTLIKSKVANNPVIWILYSYILLVCGS